MSAKIVKLVFLVCVLSYSAFGIAVKPGATLKDLERIDGQKIYLELLTDEASKVRTLVLMSADIQSGYLATLFSDEPRVIDYDYVFENVDIKIEGNQELDLNKGSFSRLYFVVRLKETSEIIGTSEMLSLADEAVGLSMYISSAQSGKGYGFDVLTAELEAMEKIGLAKQAVWECYDSNQASAKLARKSGFVRERSFLNSGKIVHRFVRELADK